MQERRQRGTALLSVAEMASADRAALAAGIAGEQLMEAAGRAVADAVRARLPRGQVVVLCGPGNNGGDGFVAARHLRAAGWPVRVALLGESARLRGDAALNFGRWGEPVAALDPAALDGASVVVDALFGAGLARPLEGAARAVVEAIGPRGVPVVAVDIPSGLHGDTGEILGAAAEALVTVTFFRMKPGHLLLPGRLLCGEVLVADIGIPDTVLAAIGPATYVNDPALWLACYPWPKLTDHKYRRGHALVVAGARMTGAGKLAARAAMRVGAGLVTVTSPPAAEPIFQGATAGLLTEPFADFAAFTAVLESRGKSVYLLGPGNEATAETRARVLAALATGRPCVLDADALSCFAGDPGALRAAVKGPAVLTPHEGEFARIFAGSGDKLTRARRAAREAGVVVLLKGADSVIADPDSRAAICRNAPAVLATAGTGDVLAGLVLGLLAQKMPPFEAACAAAWLHGEAGTLAGPGLIAEDLPELLPPLLRRLKEGANALQEPPQQFMSHQP